jgi:hypothetical protein
MVNPIDRWESMGKSIKIPRCEPWCWNIYLQNWVMFGVFLCRFLYSSTMVQSGIDGKYWNPGAKRTRFQVELQCGDHWNADSSGEGPRCAS